jgi:hypothetical protein
MYSKSDILWYLGMSVDDLVKLMDKVKDKDTFEVMAKILELKCSIKNIEDELNHTKFGHAEHLRRLDGEGCMEWVAQFNHHNTGNPIKIGIKKNRHLYFLYFDFDIYNADGCEDSREKIIEHIKKRWGCIDTFKML